MITQQANSLGLYRRVHRRLQPFLGERVARTVLLLHCAKLGLDPAELAAADIPALSTSLAHGLRAFVGRERADKLVAAIRDEFGPG